MKKKCHHRCMNDKKIFPWPQPLLQKHWLAAVMYSLVNTNSQNTSVSKETFSSRYNKWIWIYPTERLLRTEQTTVSELNGIWTKTQLSSVKQVNCKKRHKNTLKFHNTNGIRWILENQTAQNMTLCYRQWLDLYCDSICKLRWIRVQPL